MYEHPSRGVSDGRSFLRRNRIFRQGSSIHISFDDFVIGEDIIIHGTKFHILGCDERTRQVFLDRGIELAPDIELENDDSRSVVRFVVKLVWFRDMNLGFFVLFGPKFHDDIFFLAFLFHHFLFLLLISVFILLNR